MNSGMLFVLQILFILKGVTAGDTMSTKLPWPITDPSEPGVLLAHGPHCVQTLQKLRVNETTDDTDIMHKFHCERLIQRVLLFLQSNENFNPPQIICNDMKKLRSKRAAKGVSFTYNYARKKRDNAVATTNHEPGVSGDNNSNRTLNDDNRQIQFDRLSGKHFGKLLMKEWHHERLSDEQKRYLAMWNSEETVHFAAFGILCQYADDRYQAISLLTALIS